MISLTKFLLVFCSFLQSLFELSLQDDDLQDGAFGRNIMHKDGAHRRNGAVAQTYTKDVSGKAPRQPAGGFEDGEAAGKLERCYSNCYTIFHSCHCESYNAKCETCSCTTLYLGVHHEDLLLEHLKGGTLQSCQSSCVPSCVLHRHSCKTTPTCSRVTPGSDAEPSQYHVNSACSYLHNGQDLSCTEESAFCGDSGPVARSCLLSHVRTRWNLFPRRHGDRYAGRCRDASA